MPKHFTKKVNFNKLFKTRSKIFHINYNIIFYNNFKNSSISFNSLRIDLCRIEDSESEPHFSIWYNSSKKDKEKNCFTFIILDINANPK